MIAWFCYVETERMMTDIPVSLLIISQRDVGVIVYTQSLQSSWQLRANAMWIKFDVIRVDEDHVTLVELDKVLLQQISPSEEV